MAHAPVAGDARVEAVGAPRYLAEEILHCTADGDVKSEKGVQAIVAHLADTRQKNWGVVTAAPRYIFGTDTAHINNAPRALLARSVRDVLRAAIDTALATPAHGNEWVHARDVGEAHV